MLSSDSAWKWSTCWPCDDTTATYLSIHVILVIVVTNSSTTFVIAIANTTGTSYCQRRSNNTTLKLLFTPVTSRNRQKGRATTAYWSRSRCTRRAWCYHRGEDKYSALSNRIALLPRQSRNVHVRWEWFWVFDRTTSTWLKLEGTSEGLVGVQGRVHVSISRTWLQSLCHHRRCAQLGSKHYARRAPRILRNMELSRWMSISSKNATIWMMLMKPSACINWFHQCGGVGDGWEKKNCRGFMERIVASNKKFDNV